MTTEDLTQHPDWPAWAANIQRLYRQGTERIDVTKWLRETAHCGLSEAHRAIGTVWGIYGDSDIGYGDVRAATLQPPAGGAPGADTPSGADARSAKPVPSPDVLVGDPGVPVDIYADIPEDELTVSVFRNDILDPDGYATLLATFVPEKLLNQARNEARTMSRALEDLVPDAAPIRTGADFEAALQTLTRRSRGDVVEVNALLGAVAKAIRGEEVGDFEMSNGLVREAADLFNLAHSHNHAPE